MANKAVQSEFLLAGVRDANGLPLAGGKVFHYAAGTLTDKTAWTQSDKSASAAQPFILDSAGRGQLFLDGLYKFVIKDASDVTVYTFDNVAYVIDGSIIRVGDAVAPGVFLSNLFDGTATAVLKPGQFIFKKGADVTAASNLAIGTDGNVFFVTGNTTINTINSLGVGAWIRLIFTGTPLIVHSASIILPSALNIQIVAGDVLDFVESAAGVWRLATASRTVGGGSFVNGMVRGIEMYISGTESVTIKAGLIVEANGVVGVVNSDQILDGLNAAHREGGLLTGSSPAYVYIIPPSNNNDPLVVGTNMKWSSTAPTYSSSKKGWYHPTSTTWRAIGNFYKAGVMLSAAQIENKLVFRQFNTSELFLVNQGSATVSTALTRQPDAVCGVMARVIGLETRMDSNATAIAAGDNLSTILFNGTLDQYMNIVEAAAAWTPANGDFLSFRDCEVHFNVGIDTLKYINVGSKTLFSAQCKHAMLKLS